jgi:hypothetical protein
MTDIWDKVYSSDESFLEKIRLMIIKIHHLKQWRFYQLILVQNLKQILSHLYMMINKGYLAIPEKYDKLIVSLRTAQAKDYSLDKEQTSYSDSLDALRLSLKGYNIR